MIVGSFCAVQFSDLVDMKLITRGLVRSGYKKIKRSDGR